MEQLELETIQCKTLNEYNNKIQELLLLKKYYNDKLDILRKEMQFISILRKNILPSNCIGDYQGVINHYNITITTIMMNILDMQTLLRQVYAQIILLYQNNIRYNHYLGINKKENVLSYTIARIISFDNESNTYIAIVFNCKEYLGFANMEAQQRTIKNDFFIENNLMPIDLQTYEQIIIKFANSLATKKFANSIYQKHEWMLKLISGNGVVA